MTPSTALPTRPLAATAARLVVLLALCAPISPLGAADRPPAARAPKAEDGFPAEGLIGVVYAQRSLDVHAEIAGRVDSVAVDLGQRVARGALLVRLDRRALQNEVEAAKADEAVAAADLRVAELERDLAGKRMERREKSADAYSKEELDDFEHQLALARAKAERAQAVLQRQRSLVANLADKLDKATLRAPFAGTIARRYADPGILLAAGDPVVRLISDRDLRVRFGVPEKILGGLTPGAMLDARFPLAGLRADVTLSRITREIDPVTGFATAEGVLNVPDAQAGRIVAGMSVRVHAPRSTASR